MGKKEKKELDIKDLQNNLSDKAREVWLAGLGALATVEEEGNKFYDTLKAKGEDLEKRGKKQIESTLDSVKKSYKETEKKVTDTVTNTVEDSVKQVMDKFDIPSRDEVKNLISKVESLTKKVDELNKSQKSSSASAPVSAPAAKAASSSKTSVSTKKTASTTAAK